MEVFLTSVWGTRRSAEIAIEAERLGFTGVWLAEHHGTEYGRCEDAVELALSIVERTSHLKVGTAAVPFWRSAPSSLAARVAGCPRLTLGVARGSKAEAQCRPEVYEHGFGPWLTELASLVDGVKVAASSTPTITLAASLGLPLLLGVENDDAAVASKLAVWGTGGDHVRVVLPSNVDWAWMLSWQGLKLPDPGPYVRHLRGITTTSLVRRQAVMLEAVGQGGF